MGKAKEAKRSRTLSVDWDNMLSSALSSLKPNVSRVAGHMQPLTTHPGSIENEKPTCNFCTESMYTGQWNSIGMCGFGTYIFPHKVEYEGSLRDGMFHGEGTLAYPVGAKIDGIWIKGKMVSWKFRFSDGLEYESPWSYCTMPDRRFWVSIQEGMKPARRELLTNNQPTRDIPEGCYDCGDGFYNPKTKCVMSSIYPKKVLRVPTMSEETWIIENCRKAWDEPVGYKPHLYEYWISGRSAELGRFDQCTSSTSVISPITSANCIETDSLQIFVTVPNSSMRGELDALNDTANWWTRKPATFRKSSL